MSGCGTIKAMARRPYRDDEQRYTTASKPFDEQALITAAISWVLESFPQVTGIATAGETTPLGMAIEAEANRMSAAEAAEVLAAVADYASPFVG